MSTHNPFSIPPADLPSGVLRDRYCSPYVTLENCTAVTIELDEVGQLQTTYRFWRTDQKRIRVRCRSRRRIRDLRKGDVISVEGKRRTVRSITIFR